MALGLNYEPPDEITYTPMGPSFSVSTPSPVLSGPLTELTNWVVQHPGGPSNPTAIIIPDFNISLANAAWTGVTLTSVCYTPTANRFHLVGPGVLAGFDLSIPYP